MSKQLQYEKDMAFLKAYLLGRKFFAAVKHLKLSESLTPGFRKDGETPAFHHQVIIAFNFMALSKENISLEMEEQIYSTIFAHDVAEDQKMNRYDLLDVGFEVETAVNSLALNKHTFATTHDYYNNLAKYSVLAIVKGCDRLHNVFSMKGAFTPEKIVAYCQETELVVLPMLKTAANRFPEYFGTIQGIRLHLKQQLDIYKHFSENKPSR